MEVAELVQVQQLEVVGLVELEELVVEVLLEQ